MNLFCKDEFAPNFNMVLKLVKFKGRLSIHAPSQKRVLDVRGCGPTYPRAKAKMSVQREEGVLEKTKVTFDKNL